MSMDKGKYKSKQGGGNGVLVKKGSSENSAIVKKDRGMKQEVDVSGGCLEGMSTAELTMVRKLAGNDPMVRKKTLRKLKKWLNVLSQKVPDVQDCRPMIEPNFIRVWKALFYCMWMADKPLPQEQLAESLSGLQDIFASKTYPFLLFVEWFIRTIAREWNWIDRFRMDKFMMLFRRFLRKSLLVIAEKKWQNGILLGYLSIVSTHIFNRHPPTKGKKQQPVTPTAVAPLGFQIHFIDIFMEELAKVGGEELKFQKTLKILGVFIQELGYNNDDRLLGEIRERIFNHLMMQSDVGMDYQEMMANGGEEVEEEEEDETEEHGEEAEADEKHDEEAEADEDDELIGDIEEDLEMDDPTVNEVLDPRVGMDVILPQLNIDHGILYQKLVEYGGRKDLKLKNRRILYSLASQFKELTTGKYPLALPEDKYMGAAVPQREVNKAAKRLLEEEGGELGGKRRLTKKERKRAAKRRLNASNASADSVGSEDSSRYINDEELLDHVADNYMSYLEDEMEPGQVGSAQVEDETDGVEEQELTQPTDENQGGKLKKVKKEKKNRKRKWETVVEVEAEENGNETVDTIPEDDNIENEQEEVLVIKRPKIRKRSSLSSNDILRTPLIGKARRLSELRTPNNKSSPLNNSLNSSASKRVSFILARNKEHEHADYSDSIARSPSIPFDKHRRPSFGLLKSPATTPRSTPIKRASALDFF